MFRFSSNFLTKFNKKVQLYKTATETVTTATATETKTTARTNTFKRFLKYSIMSVNTEINSNQPLQEEIRLDPIIEKPSETQRKIINPKSNSVKRKRASHRKPPRINYDSTSPLGVLTEFEIPNMLTKYHDKVCQLLNIEDSNSINPLTINDVMNPVRDIINDAGVLDAFNWREIKNVEVLCMSAKGDGLAIIKAPNYETVLKCQQIANEREKKQIEELKLKELNNNEIQDDEKIPENEDINVEGSKKRQRRAQSDEPYRRTVHIENIPKVQIATVPFAFPGDFVNIKVYHTNAHYVDSEIMEFTKLSPLRNEVLNNESLEINNKGIIKPKESACAYFGICSGCQYQSLSYENQLLIKKEVVENAYKHFCKNDVDWEGKVLDTVSSPLKFGYRTKLTPHYDVPRSGTKGLNVPRLGFGWRGKGSWLGLNKDSSEDGKTFDNSKLELKHPDNEKEGMRNRSIRPYFGDVLDIEDCIIGTDIVRLGFVNERQKLSKEWNSGVRSKKGVTVLLRENSVCAKDQDYEDRIFGSRKILPNTDIEGPVTKLETEIEGIEGKVIKTCVTDNQKIVTDLVDTGLGKVLRFDFIANEFFQNNNSILPKVIKYVKDNLDNKGEDQLEYLVDAYCGSGLFSVAIASDDNSNIKKVLGVEISERAVEFAKRNAELNNISSEHCDFIQGKAEKLFEHINFPKDKTGVILDPPRKGCDDIFLKQLSEFEPNRIVYVSCNVHSQARDVKYFLNETENGNKYKIESIRGFDFFPQTHHVESVAVLVHKS
jgi:tRNA (uracil-5-)-methyltransferase